MPENEKKKIPREGLKKARERRGLSQAELAELIGVGDAKTVRRWESGESNPYPYLRPLLAEHLNITREKLEVILANSQDQALHRRWMIPHLQNPYFTGRDNVLSDLQSAFDSEKEGILK